MPANTSDVRHESLIKRVLNWLTAGYPEGVPPTERYALIALLHRTLTADEVQQVMASSWDSGRWENVQPISTEPARQDTV